ncbi:hypothetical protein TI39_contig474g00005 [Zymoseptoria brevis]|uniref:Uncharacterized protein n=1 Tax=Zymoseptoria brevis TaxID=1047168 RepID=A0A0F4GK90_9PEZI|nr:hypothetical protein TI39_contig474g00005 [Zymoseptoria brevis]
MPAPPATSQDEARFAAQQATGIDFYPGTELMKDINNLHLKRTGTETLVPQPGSDPADPVNWSHTWKWFTMSSMVLSTFIWVFSPLALGPQVPYYMESFNSTIPEVINFTGVSILVLGLTNLIWIPFAHRTHHRWDHSGLVWLAEFLVDRNAISVFTNVWIIFFLPETKWDRRKLDASTAANAGRLDSSSINAGTEKMPTSNSEQSVVDAAHVEHSSHAPVEELGASLHGRPNRRQFMPIAPWRAHESILNAIILPFNLIRFPIVLWGTCQFTCACSCYLMISLTQSQALSAAPFNFTAAQVGYTNLAMFAGTSIALLTAGPLGDWMSRRAKVRNDGVREPEMRLPALEGWKWEVIVVVGSGLVGVQVAAISGIAINYVVDCYQPAAGEFLVGATVIKNVWGYGMSKFINNWIVLVGYVGPLMTITAMNAALLVFGAVPLCFFGKKVRGWSAKSAVHRAG